MEAEVKGQAKRDKGNERELLSLFARLAPSRQNRLLAFAEFLVRDESAAESREHVTTVRPARETVTMAIRRLVRSYPMLERRRLMGEASRLMAQHSLDGRPAAEVIDELEMVFARHYGQLKSKAESRKAKG